MCRFTFFALALAACSTSNPLYGGNADLSAAAGHDLSAPPGSDLSIPPGSDLSIPPGADLAASPDLAGGCLATCAPPFMCCGDTCVNTQNDPNHCGDCVTICPDRMRFCGGGNCSAPPCGIGTICLGTDFCCGTNCCAKGQLCCDVQGPGPTTGPSCYTPTSTQPTCPLGCPLCG